MSRATEKNGPPRQLLAFVFPPGAAFEGRLSGALQRIESGGALRILDALFVGRDAESGELTAVALTGASSAGMIGKLVGFRLDDAARKKETQAALDGPLGELVRELGTALRPGWSLAGVLVEHVWASVLEEAVAHIGGQPLVNEPVTDAAPGAIWTKLARQLAARPRAEG